MASSINASTSGAGGIITTADNTGTLNLQSGGTTIATIDSTGLTMASGKKVFSEGSVLQVVNAQTKAVSSYTAINIGNSYSNNGRDEAGSDLTPFTVSITPSSASNKILIITNINMGLSDQMYGVMRLKRCIGASCTPTFSSTDAWMADMTGLAAQTQQGSFPLTSRDAAGHESKMINFHWYDSPSTTSNVTYTFNVRIETDIGSTFYVNRSYYGSNDYGSTSGVSSVTLMEIKG